VAGTQKGDVYSFGIILYELHARHGPFGEPGLTPPEILLRVIRPDPDQPPFRYTASFCFFTLKKKIVIIIIIIAFEFSIVGSSPYTSTEKINKYKRT